MVVLPPDAHLPDGTQVVVNVEATVGAGASFADRYQEFIGMATDLPRDLAQNLDHYLHGHAKK